MVLALITRQLLHRDRQNAPPLAGCVVDRVGDSRAPQTLRSARRGPRRPAGSPPHRSPVEQDIEFRNIGIGRHEVAGVVATVRTCSWSTGAPLVSRRREEFPIDERLEGAAERVPSVDRSIEAGLAKLDGAYKSYGDRRAPYANAKSAC